eukprot:4653020-Alexandrium_andersonii.AAC.1
MWRTAARSSCAAESGSPSCLTAQGSNSLAAAIAVAAGARGAGSSEAAKAVAAEAREAAALAPGQAA